MFARFCVFIAIGCLTQLGSAIQVDCVDKLTKHLSVFEATSNLTDLYKHVTFDIPNHECFIDQPITLDENDTLTIATPNNDEITSITFAVPSHHPEFPSIVFTIFPNLNHVHLISTGIEVLEEDDFMNATALNRLRIELNQIKRITETAFKNAVNLELLELPANGIKEIENSAFSKLKNLTKLDLQQNNLTVIGERIFSGAYNLMEIYLNDNQIHKIEEGAFYLEKLTRIYLQDNQLKMLSPDVLTGTPQLYGIDLSNNRLESVQNVFDKCANLTIIGLNGNQIKSLDLIEMAEMPSLRVLMLEGNKLKLNANNNTSSSEKRLPRKTQLEYLNLDSNNLSSSSILHQLNVFHQLKFLDLDDNKLTKIDDFKQIRTIFPHFIQINMNENPMSCAWLEDVWPFIQDTNIVFKTDEMGSDEDIDDTQFLGGNQDKVNNITCIVDKPENLDANETAASPQTVA